LRSHLLQRLLLLGPYINLFANHRHIQLYIASYIVLT
jgi:hypothetical protein